MVTSRSPKKITPLSRQVIEARRVSSSKNIRTLQEFVQEVRIRASSIPQNPGLIIDLVNKGLRRYSEPAANVVTILVEQQVPINAFKKARLGPGVMLAAGVPMERLVGEGGYSRKEIADAVFRHLSPFSRYNEDLYFFKGLQNGRILLSVLTALRKEGTSAVELFHNAFSGRTFHTEKEINRVLEEFKIVRGYLERAGYSDVGKISTFIGRIEKLRKERKLPGLWHLKDFFR